MNSPTIVWFRNDLRVSDHPALVVAAKRGSPIIPLYIWSPEEEGDWSPGAATRWWLHHSLSSLDQDLRRLGSRLIVRRGPTLRTLKSVAEETGARQIEWHRRYEPVCIDRDKAVKASLRDWGLRAESHNGSLLFEPWEIKTKTGTPYQVFTPFSKACLAQGEVPPPFEEPDHLQGPEQWPDSLDLHELKLLPKIKWDTGFQQAWTPGTAAAVSGLQQFISQHLSEYKVRRDFPAIHGTSRLSPALHFGEVSPRQIWSIVQQKCHQSAVAEPYLRQILWREFAHHLLFHFPRTPREPLRKEFAYFPWLVEPNKVKAWQRGQTGFPIVDAGMRELWTTGWMHNRVRMIVASFLVKDLLVPWQAGAEWFWDTLVDADLANNTLGWQWTAGCGADAAPYFRVFNPISQGEKFDPTGEYVRHWVPELKNVPNEWLHQPWNAPPLALRDANVRLGKNYPLPIVDHDDARKQALAALDQMKQDAQRPG